MSDRVSTTHTEQVTTEAITEESTLSEGFDRPTVQHRLRHLSKERCDPVLIQ